MLSDHPRVQCVVWRRVAALVVLVAFASVGGAVTYSGRADACQGGQANVVPAGGSGGALAGGASGRGNGGASGGTASGGGGAAGDARGPIVLETVPKTGESYPANAYVLIRYASENRGLTATVDGVPTSLTIDWKWWSSALALRPTPEPPVGAEVRISGDACSISGSVCPIDLRYTVTEPDLTAPPELTEFGFNVHDYPTLGNPCAGDYSTMALWFHVNGRASSGGAPSGYLLEWFRDTALTDFVMDQRFVPSSFPAVWEEEEQVDIPPDSYCFRASAIDTADNQSAPRVACKPCYLRTDTAQVDPHVEPAWSDADIYPSGPCHAAPPSSLPEATSRVSTSTGGCSIPSAQISGRGPVHFAALVALMAAMCRRRVRATTRRHR